jgi:hypothetical protein
MIASVSPAAGSPAGPSAPPSSAPLHHLLDAVRRRTRRWIWVESLAVVGLALVAAIWTTLVIDRLVEPPAWVRVGLLAAAVGVVGTILVTRLVRRLAVPLTDESLALIVERAHPEFRDALSTAVACGGADADHGPLDPELLARTTATAVTLAGRVRPDAIFRRRRLTGVALAALLAAAGTALTAVARPTEAGVWARRLFLLADEPWPRRVALAAADFPDGVRVVARGADADIVVRASAAGRMPELVELRVRGAGGWRTERMGTRGAATAEGQTFGHVLKGVTEDLAVEVRGGDARLRGLRIVVADPPAIADLAITCTLPGYLGGGSRDVAASRLVRIPRGARVQVVCRATKPLASATVAVRPATGEATAAEQVLAELDPSAAGARSIEAVLPALDGDVALVVRLTDTEGLANRDSVAAVLSAIPDERPQLMLRLAGISNAVTPQAVLPIEGTIADDHGLVAAAVRVTSGDAVHTATIDRVAAGAPVVEFPADRPETVRLADLSLAVGSRVEVVVTARDGCTLDGEGNEASGDTWTLDVVAPESLQALLEAREILLRRRFEAAIDDFAKARDAVAAPPRGADADEAATVTRCAEATARAAGEATEIAAEFRGIRRELANNALLTPEMDARLTVQVAAPLEALVGRELAAVAAACRSGTGADRPAVVRLADLALARMREVLARMLELESVNEVIERLRGVIRVQEEIRSDTLERQRKRGREALESP